MREGSGKGRELAGRGVLVVGLARTGLATAEFLARRGARVRVSEMRPEREVAEAASAVRRLGVELECGGHRPQSFAEADLVVLSPGVPFDLPALAAARRRGVECISELELAGRFLRGTVVAVTGSNGKTTTTALLGEIFTRAGRPTQVGGNIGTPLIRLVESAQEDTINVVEASSFQLEATVSFRPRVGVFLNLTPDHLDRHPSLAAYAAAKLRLFACQERDDFAIWNADDGETTAHAQPGHARLFQFSRQQGLENGAFLEGPTLVFTRDAVREAVMDRAEIQLPGEHNVENVLAGVCAARLLGVSAEVIRAAVADFTGVEHRLEFVAEVEGVSYYNDSKATNVDAAEKAVAAFPGPLVVLLGGKDKGSDFRPLREPLRKRARRVLLIGAARDKIREQLEGAVPLELLETLPPAVARAAELALPGDTVLLAPACASFDQFENFEHRGRVFKEEVRKLAHSMGSPPGAAGSRAERRGS